MPKGVRLKPEQIVAKLREIEVKIGQGKDVLTACREACSRFAGPEPLLGCCVANLRAKCPLTDRSDSSRLFDNS